MRPTRAGVTDTLQRGSARLASLYPSPAEPLAAPPEGSGLEPVMGSYGIPGLGHVLESSRARGDGTP